MRHGPERQAASSNALNGRAPKISEDQTGYRTVSRDWCDRARGSEGSLPHTPLTLPRISWFTRRT